ncbi:uncharacterized protein LOC128240194 [Mya arenaria]|uniref:uncharacterized protein LOC128240194 n=1 Tax=Mya arenaria TaxID=6604 RepID=UPI0022E113F4|nr:uncharacterized protein LOC128240194 [Mya arenaria]
MRCVIMLVLSVLGMNILRVNGKSFNYLSAERFGQEHLCKTHERRQMFQRAVLGKACSSSEKQGNTGFTNDDFMLFMVDSLCKDSGGWLAEWVRQHVDTDGDERISRFEEDMFYNAVADLETL